MAIISRSYLECLINTTALFKMHRPVDKTKRTISSNLQNLLSNIYQFNFFTSLLIENYATFKPLLRGWRPAAISPKFNYFVLAQNNPRSVPKLYLFQGNWKITKHSRRGGAFDENKRHQKHLLVLKIVILWSKIPLSLLTLNCSDLSQFNPFQSSL